MRAVLGLFFIVIRKTCRVKCVCVQMLQCSKMVRYLLNLKEKASSVDLDHAASELCSKFHMNAGKLFPLGSDCILGITKSFVVTEILRARISKQLSLESIFFTIL